MINFSPLLQELSVLRPAKPAQVFAISDIGRDLDDELSLVMLAGLARLGFAELAGVVANYGETDMRARLARGALAALGQGHVPVKTGERIIAGDKAEGRYEFESSYLAPTEGYELLNRTFDAAQENELTILLISGLTDFNKFLGDHPEKKNKIARVVIMGGVILDAAGSPQLEEGRFVPDSAFNNAVDDGAARALYKNLQELNIPTTVLTRFAAYAGAVDHDFFEAMAQTRHVVGVELAEKKARSTTHLFNAVQKPAGDPGRGQLPDRCDLQWMFNSFSSDPTAARAAYAADPAAFNVAQHLSKGNLYDPLALLAAVMPDAMNIFEPASVMVKGTEHRLIGVSKTAHGIHDQEKLQSLMTLLVREALTAPRLSSPAP